MHGQQCQQLQHAPDMKLFYACFVALITTSFGFILRAIMLPEWGKEFNLTQTQLGEIAGVGLWPFAISIVLFSLIIDKIGYKTAMVFALSMPCYLCDTYHICKRLLDVVYRNFYCCIGKWYSRSSGESCSGYYVSREKKQNG